MKFLDPPLIEGQTRPAVVGQRRSPIVPQNRRNTRTKATSVTTQATTVTVPQNQGRTVPELIPTHNAPFAGYLPNYFPLPGYHPSIYGQFPPFNSTTLPLVTQQTTPPILPLVQPSIPAQMPPPVSPQVPLPASQHLVQPQVPPQA